MVKRNGKRVVSVIAVAAMTASLLAGCSGNSGADDEKETISVYLWSNTLNGTYAPYIQSQLPDVNIQFVVGNNDLDFYKFMNENGHLPDIITSRRFSLHDAACLKDQLMDLSTTEQAGTIYESYLGNFTNTDGTVNWLPMCGEVDGLVANKGLFDEYGIPLPTDYDSFISACQAFEEKGIRGFVSDFAYDYTCMEVLQGLSIPEITSMEGRLWRSSYEDPADDSMVGLDDTVWPEVFERMEKFIDDAKVQPGDLDLSFNPVIDMFTNGQAAIIREGGANVVGFRDDFDVEAVFLPYFGQNGEQWLLTYPAFQVALNKDLEKDKSRQEKALQVLNVMLSSDAQNVLAGGGDVITYSQNVDLELSPYLSNLTPLIQQNHMYIRIASNDFFAVSKDVVSKMISGEYDAKQAYEAFDAQLRQPKDTSAETILTIDKDYSNVFHRNGGNEAYSVMANSLRQLYGSDVLVAPAYCFNGSVFKADYSEKMVGYMIMPNALCAWKREMKGDELKEYIRTSVEGIEGGFAPYNRCSLPTVSGISIEVKEEDGKFTLTRVLKDGKEIGDDDTFMVATLNTTSYMGVYLKDESRVFEREETRVREALTAYIKDGGTLAEPENYITLT